MKSYPTIRDVVCIAVFRNKKVLVVKTEFSGDMYYFLGGTRERGESDIDCLMREVKEEANVEVIKESLIHLKTFDARAHGRENTIVRMHLYKGNIIGTPLPTNEITDIEYIDSSIEETVKTPLAKIVLKWLLDNKYIG